MTIANSEPRRIPPTHPGEMLREDFMPAYKLTASGLATALGVSRQTIYESVSYTHLDVYKRQHQPPVTGPLPCMLAVRSTKLPQPSGRSGATRIRRAPLCSWRSRAASTRRAHRPASRLPGLTVMCPTLPQWIGRTLSSSRWSALRRASAISSWLSLIHI